MGPFRRRVRRAEDKLTGRGHMTHIVAGPAGTDVKAVLAAHGIKILPGDELALIEMWRDDFTPKWFASMPLQRQEDAS